MAQFDVHRSPLRGRPDVPFVVILQSAWFDDAPDRLVAPLLLAEGAQKLRAPRHMPRFLIAGHGVLMDPLQCRPIPRQLLNDPIASLADDESASRIIAAMDEVLSRAYR